MALPAIKTSLVLLYTYALGYVPAYNNHLFCKSGASIPHYLRSTILLSENPGLDETVVVCNCFYSQP